MMAVVSLASMYSNNMSTACNLQLVCSSLCPPHMDEIAIKKEILQVYLFKLEIFANF